jgi:hypothetical protein
MSSRAESISSYPHLLLWLLLVNSVFSETVQHACPSKCKCEIYDDSNDSCSLSVTCSYLKLTEIPTAPSSCSVQSLDLSDNKLTRIRELTFKDYRTLESLSLSYNEIDVVDSRAFLGLEMLRNVDLSHNKLRVIPPNIFSNNSFLERVLLSENHLVYVADSQPILASTSVRYLDLSSCSLTSINTHTFSQLPSLQSLDLNSNSLQEIHQDVLYPLSRLIVLNLENNRLKCDCDLVDVLNWLSDRRKSRGLEGEHRPVKCVEGGMYRTIWTAANRNKSCTKQSTVISATTIPTEPSQILQTKENEEEIPTAGMWCDELFCWSTNTVLVFIILSLILAIAVFVALVGVHCVIKYVNSRRQRTESLVQRKGTEKSKINLFSRIPFFSFFIYSDSFAEKCVTHSATSSEDTSSACEPCNFYETIKCDTHSLLVPG